MKHIKKFKESEKDNSSDILEYISDCFIDFKDVNKLIIEPKYYNDNCIFLRVDIDCNRSFIKDVSGFNKVDYDEYKKFSEQMFISYNNLYDAIDKVESNYTDIKTEICSFCEENGIKPIYIYFKL